MDDLLKSVYSNSQAIALYRNWTELLKRGGFRLAKWISDSKEVIKNIPDSDVCKSVLNVRDSNYSSCQRVLGIQWKFKTDVFRFNITVKQKPFTSRRLLSVISTLFDPLGFAAPVSLKAKLLLLESCSKRLGWDEEIDKADSQRWRTWLEELPKLESIQLPVVVCC